MKSKLETKRDDLIFAIGQQFYFKYLVMGLRSAREASEKDLKIAEKSFSKYSNDVEKLTAEVKSLESKEREKGIKSEGSAEKTTGRQSQTARSRGGILSLDTDRTST